MFIARKLAYQLSLQMLDTIDLLDVIWDDVNNCIHDPAPGDDVDELRAIRAAIDDAIKAIDRVDKLADAYAA